MGVEGDKMGDLFCFIHIDLFCKPFDKINIQKGRPSKLISKTNLI